MSSQRLGIIAKMDVVDLEDGVAMPVDFKKGKRPHVAAGAYEPERVQVCAQAMILEDNGYRVEQGALWYVGSRERVPVVLDDQLRARTNDAISGLRSAAMAGRRPPAPAGQPQVSSLLPRGNLPAGRDEPVQARRAAQAVEPVGRCRQTAPCADAASETAQEWRTVGGGRRGQEDGGSARRSVRRGDLRPGVGHDAGVAFTDARGDSGVLVHQRRLVRGATRWEPVIGT